MCINTMHGINVGIKSKQGPLAALLMIIVGQFENSFEFCFVIFFPTSIS